MGRRARPRARARRVRREPRHRGHRRHRRGHRRALADRRRRRSCSRSPARASRARRSRAAWTSRTGSSASPSTARRAPTCASWRRAPSAPATRSRWSRRPAHGVTVGEVFVMRRADAGPAAAAARRAARPRRRLDASCVAGCAPLTRCPGQAGARGEGAHRPRATAVPVARRSAARAAVRVRSDRGTGGATCRRHDAEQRRRLAHRPPSVGRMFLDRVAAHPDREAYRRPVGDGWESMTWGQTGERVQRARRRPARARRRARGAGRDRLLDPRRVGARRPRDPVRRRRDHDGLPVDHPRGRRATSWPTPAPVVAFAEDDDQVAKLRDAPRRAARRSRTRRDLRRHRPDGDWVIGLADLERAAAREHLADDPDAGRPTRSTRSGPSTSRR